MTAVVPTRPSRSEWSIHVRSPEGATTIEDAPEADLPLALDVAAQLERAAESNEAHPPAVKYVLEQTDLVELERASIGSATPDDAEEPSTGEGGPRESPSVS